MKQFNLFATRVSYSPQKWGQSLVSLDSQNTNKYNDEYDVAYHNLSPFIGHRFSHEGSNLVAIPLRNSTQKLFKILFLALLPLLLISCSQKEPQNHLEFATEDFFYQSGYENGYTAGYEAGVLKAFSEAKNVLKKYRAELQAYEIGKYLIKNQNLTYPQVWQEVDASGLVKLRVLPSKIIKEFNVEELFANFSELPSLMKKKEETTTLSLEEKNSVDLSQRDSNSNALPQKVFSANSKSILRIQKTANHLDILKRANVVFSDEGEFYHVLFFTKTEQEHFCKQFSICN